MKIIYGTRKGLIQFEYRNGKFEYLKDDFLGFPVTMFHINKFTNRWFCALYHGHWGEKLHCSDDKGKTWRQLETPKFPAHAADYKPGKKPTIRLFWGMNCTKDSVFLGTIPGALFRSNDNGESFHLVESAWNEPTRQDIWFGAGFDEPGIHTIEINPFNDKEIYLGISCAGVFVTNDDCKTWQFKNKGITAPFLPNPKVEVGHDPHLFLMHPKNPKVFWQQSHVGVYKSTDGADNWIEVSDKDKGVDFGFTIVLDEEDEKRAWVIPAKSDEQRVAIDHALKVCETKDAGTSWIEHKNGLPQSNAYDFVYRHAFSKKQNIMAFGTTSGNGFSSANEGKDWACVSNYLPLVNTVDVVE